MNIVIEHNPSSTRLSDLGVMSWPKWSCQPGKYALVFEERETCYLVKGKVKVYPKGSSDFVEFGAGDLVTIPKGLSCTWDISLFVDKHYKEPRTGICLYTFQFETHIYPDNIYTRFPRIPSKKSKSRVYGHTISTTTSSEKSS